MSNDVWNDDATQFPRLLAEIWGVGLNDSQIAALCETMDLEPEQIDELFERADREWHRLKYGNDFDYDAELRTRATHS